MPTARRSRHVLLLATIAAALSQAGGAEAATKYWVGGTTSGGLRLFSTSANWSPSGDVQDGDTVILRSANNVPMVIDQTVRLAAFTIESGYTSTVTHTTSVADNSPTMVISGDFTMAGEATFTAPLGRLSIGGRFNKTAGTFTHSNAGLVVLASSASRNHSYDDAAFPALITTDQAAVSSGLVGYWKLDGDGNDASGNSYHLTATGADFSPYPKVAAVFGTNTDSARLDTLGDYLARTSIEAAFDTNTWSASIWFQATTLDAGGCSDLLNVGDNYYLRLCNTGVVTVYMRKAADNSYANCPSSNSVPINDDYFRHVVATNDGTRLRVYLEGVETECSAHGATQDYDGTVLRLGRNPNNSTYDIIARLDEARIYNRALTDLEVLSLWAAVPGTAGTATHAGSGTLTVADDLWLGNGTFSGTTNLRVGGAWRQFGGSYTGTGSVMLNATSNQSHDFGSAALTRLVVNDGLLAYWPLDSDYTDLSGYDWTLTAGGSPSLDTSTITQVTWTNAASADLTGGTDYLYYDGYPSEWQPENWTISAWVRITTFDMNGAVVFTADNNWGMLINPTGTIRAYKYDGSHRNCDSTATIVTGAWYHLTATHNAGTTTLYINGDAVAGSGTCTGVGSLGVNGTSDKVFIGRHPSNTTYDLHGRVDEFRVYKRALSAAEVALLASGSQFHTASVTHTVSSALNVDQDLVIASGALTPASTVALGSLQNLGGLLNTVTSLTLDPSASGRLLRTGGQRFTTVTFAGTGSAAWTLQDDLHADTISVSGGSVSPGVRSIHSPIFSSSGGSFATSSGSRIVVESTSIQNVAIPGTPSNVHFEDPTETGLVGYWKFDRFYSNTSPDLSGNNNTATLVNGAGIVTGSTNLPTTLYANRAAVRLDGTDSTTTGDYVSLGTTNLPQTYGTKTVSFWVKFTSDGDTQDFLTLSNGSTSGIRIGTASNKVRVMRYNGTTMLVETSANAVSDGVWHHVAYTYESGTHRLYIDSNAAISSATAGDTTAAVSVANVGVLLSSTMAGRFDGSLDDLRIYTTRLSDTDIAVLAAGRYPGKGGTTTMTLAANLAAADALQVDSGTLATGGFDLAAGSGGASTLSYVNAGQLTVAANSDCTFSDGLTVQPQGTLLFNGTSSTLALPSARILTIDGTLQTTTGIATPKPLISSTAGGVYFAFKVGAGASTTPVLDIDGLTVLRTDTNGMQVNAVATATTTFTKFNNIAFAGGTGNYLLQIAANTLSLDADGLTFDSSNTASNVFLDDRDGDGNNVRFFIAATCSAPDSDCEAHDLDDDSAADGLPNDVVIAPVNSVDDTAADGAVIGWGDRYHSDIGGTISEFSSTAFRWDTYAFHGTYVLSNNYSGSDDRLVRRDEDGDQVTNKSWDPSTSTSDFKGSPRWTWVSGTTFYVFMIAGDGTVFRVTDSGAGVFSGEISYRDGGSMGSASATSQLSLSTTHVFWAGNDGSGAASVMRLTHALGTVDSYSSGAVYAGAALATYGGTQYLFTVSGTTLYRLIASSLDAYNNFTVTGAATVYGRVTVLDGLAYFVDNAGVLRVVNGSTTPTMSSVWSYSDSTNHGGCTSGGACAAKNLFVDYYTRRVYYGDDDGHVYAIVRDGSTANGKVVNAGFPLNTGSTANGFQTAPLYRNGVIAIGADNGRVFFIDEAVGAGNGALIRSYQFANAISGISYDFEGTQYVITTQGGKVYYITEISGS